MPVDYHYWYDGFTVGMNDSDEQSSMFAVQLREPHVMEDQDRRPGTRGVVAFTGLS